MVVSISSYKDISIVCVLRYTSATQLVWSERMRLKDKVAIISGGAKGMGAAEAKLLNYQAIFFSGINAELKFTANEGFREFLLQGDSNSRGRICSLLL